LFDPRTSSGRFSDFENEDLEKLAVASGGNLRCYASSKLICKQQNSGNRITGWLCQFATNNSRKVVEINKRKTYISLQEKYSALKEAMKVTEKEAALVNKLKKFSGEQSKDSKWKEHRVRRITASKAP